MCWVWPSFSIVPLLVGVFLWETFLRLKAVISYIEFQLSSRTPEVAEQCLAKIFWRSNSNEMIFSLRFLVLNHNEFFFVLNYDVSHDKMREHNNSGNILIHILDWKTKWFTLESWIFQIPKYKLNNKQKETWRERRELDIHCKYVGPCAV